MKAGTPLCGILARADPVDDVVLYVEVEMPVHIVGEFALLKMRERGQGQGQGQGQCISELYINPLERERERERERSSSKLMNMTLESVFFKHLARS